MPDTLILPDSIAAHANSPAFTSSSTDGGLNAAWVAITGELDLASAPQLERTLSAPQLQARLVVLDLRELASIDSAGVQAIVNASIRARQKRRRLVLLRGPPNVDRMFALTGSTDDLEIGEVGPVEPTVAALLQLADEELGS